MNKDSEYVHGYSDRETYRLSDQANTLAELLHNDTFYPDGSIVLEAGCGTGAQTIILSKNSPKSKIISMDISQESLIKASALNLQNVSFQIADIFNLPFKEESFDHVFLCFVLEHLQEPLKALNCLKKVLKKGGSITVIEGDHGSCYFYPESDEAHKTIQCLIKIQEFMKGNSLIGRQVFPLLKKAEFENVKVSPRMVYVDSSKPQLVDGFTKKTFIAMVEGVKDQALSLGMVDEYTWEKGISDLYRTTDYDGTFCYTFFKGIAIR